MKGIKLTEEEKKERYEYMLSHNYYEFAEKYHVTPNTARVSYCKNHISIATPEYRYDVPEEEFKEYASNHNIMSVCKHFKVSWIKVKRLYDLYKIPIRTKRQLGLIKYEEVNAPVTRSADRDEMIRYLAKEFTQASIARVFGYSKQRIQQIVNHTR